MNSDEYGEFSSRIKRDRLPSLMALRCFEAAARCESFTRAAQELCLTHGAVSRAVRVLEEDLGAALFHRRSRRVFLTDAGRSLALAVREGLEVMRRAVREIRAGSEKEKLWTLSCEPTLLMRWLIPRWPGFQSRYPDAKVRLAAGGGTFAFGDGIDLAIRRDDFPWGGRVGMPSRCSRKEWARFAIRIERAPGLQQMA